MKRPVRMSLEIVGAGAGVEDVAVEERVALPLLMSSHLQNRLVINKSVIQFYK